MEIFKRILTTFPLQSIGPRGRPVPSRPRQNLLCRPGATTIFQLESVETGLVCSSSVGLPSIPPSRRMTGQMLPRILIMRAQGQGNGYSNAVFGWVVLPPSILPNGEDPAALSRGSDPAGHSLRRSWQLMFRATGDLTRENHITALHLTQV